MAEIVNAERIEHPAARLIGRRYTDADRVEGTFSAQWDAWFSGGLFAPLEALPLPEGDPFFDGSTVGAMRMLNGTFEYWVGMLFPADTPVPAGYAGVDLAPGSCAVLWLRGSESSGELYGPGADKLCLAELKRQGWMARDGGWWMERYQCPRFTTPDEEGNVILDYVISLDNTD